MRKESGSTPDTSATTTRPAYPDYTENDRPACPVCDELSDSAWWSTDTIGANASLIAAAPDLYAALERTEMLLSELLNDSDKHFPSESSFMRAHRIADQARAAIAKAESR